jgi:hypothetical protein
VSSFVGFLDILGEDVWELWSQRSWNYRTFPEQNESFLDREVLSASVKTFELRPVGVLEDTSEVQLARLDEFLHSLKQFILLGHGTEPIECDRG